MKKSEFKQKLDECYSQWVDDWLAANINELEGFVSLPDRLVKVCEDVGMKPPGVHVLCGPYDAVKYQWEDENE